MSFFQYKSCCIIKKGIVRYKEIIYRFNKYRPSVEYGASLGTASASARRHVEILFV
jgi:hypothetical protein